MMSFNRSLVFAPVVLSTAILSGCLGGDNNSVVQLGPSEPLESCMVGNWVLDKVGSTTEYEFNADGTYTLHHEAASSSLVALGLVSIILGDFVSGNDTGFYYAADAKGSWWVNDDGKLMVRQEARGSDNAYTKATARRISLEEMNTPDPRGYTKTIGSESYCGNDMWFLNVMSQTATNPRVYESFAFAESNTNTSPTPYRENNSILTVTLQESGIVDAAFNILDEDRTNIPAQKIWSQDGDVITMRACEETDGCTVLKGIGGYSNEFLDHGAVLTAPGANEFFVRQ
ncbi:MAG: hypothetical protein ABNH16_03035 [Thalassolituus sp.]|jgi:hypothetical protein